MSMDTPAIEILFLGTGAADWPAPYRPAEGDAESGAVRGRSSVLVDGHILIDFGTTVPDAVRQFGAEAGRITDVLLTHAHQDHCDPEALACLASAADRSPLDLWAHPSALAKLTDVDGVRTHEVEIGDRISLQSVSVTALAANHDVPDETPLHFLLQKSGTSVLYATDGAWFLKPTWMQLRDLRLDALVWDATCGETSGDWRIFEHNSLDMIRVMRRTLMDQGVLSEASKVYLTHMSKRMCARHEEMAARLAPEGLILAHDGMAVSIGGDAAASPPGAA